MIALNEDFLVPEDGDRQPQFLPGQLVCHRRYGYRGVVVQYDRQCTADPKWYASNNTQPERNQPWYHVLVHGSGSVTYAAESSLQADDSREPVSHVLLEHFFSSFTDGRYLRNDRPWPR